MMQKIILKSVMAENFASFANRVVFTCVADESKKEYQMNTFQAGEDTINKVSYVYGANGSGKTFFCKILREFQKMILLSPLYTIKDLQTGVLSKEFKKQIPYFIFDIEHEEIPITLGADFIIEDVTYHYEFSILKQKIIHELLTRKYRRTEKILERTSPNYQDITLKSELKSFESMKNVVKENILCLTMAFVLNNELANTLVDAIKGIKVLNMAVPHLGVRTPEAFSKERIQKCIKILQKADPTIRNIRVQYKEEEVIKQKLKSDDFENKEVIRTKTTVKLKSEHALYCGGIELSTVTGQIDFFEDESLGTIKLFMILLYLFDVLENGGVLILDEIENGLHLSLVKEMISLFINEESNPHHAQLICTTHQPLLVSENVKRDQVWILSKDKFGKSVINRLSDKSFSRAKVNLTNQLLEGVFGCNPEKIF